MFVTKLIVKINIEQVGLYCRLKFKDKLQKIQSLERNIRFKNYEGLLDTLRKTIQKCYSIQSLTVLFRGFQGERLEKYRREISLQVLDIILQKCMFLTSLQLCNTYDNIIDILFKYSLKFIKRLRLYNNQLSRNSLHKLMNKKYQYLNELYLIKNNLSNKSLQLLRQHTWPSLTTIRIEQEKFDQKCVPLFWTYTFGTLKKIEYVCRYSVEQKMKYTIKQQQHCELKFLNKYRQAEEDINFLGYFDAAGRKQVEDQRIKDQQTSINE